MAVRKKYDVIIIGAGASGLTCARHLLAKGLRVLILEGRSRVGGRILTATDSLQRIPIELGAEFIHGAPDIIFERLASMGMPFYDTSENRLYWNGKALVRDPKRWEKVEKVFAKMNRDLKKDRSFEDFLKVQKSIDSSTRKLLVSFIEGYQGADTTLASERGLVGSAGDDDDTLNGSATFRPAHGYTEMINGFLHGIENLEDVLRLSSIVKSIDWKKGAARVHYTSETDTAELRSIDAKAVVVTVPLGVLKSSRIAISPFPKELDLALSGLEMGHAMRIVFRFRSRFWEKLKTAQAIDEKPLSFMLGGPGFDFPTWWTSLPLRAPILTAWQGGPQCLKLAALSEDERIQTALKTLSALTGHSLEFLKSELQASYSHDWTNDPFSLGAYSYVRTGGVEHAKKLAGPFDKTLFFAGEATESGSARGTVHGAMISGRKAAEKILRYVE
jgi:monoamine oxidase